MGISTPKRQRKRMSEAHIGRVYRPHSEATKKKMSKTRQKYKRGKHPGATKVIVDGISYVCIRDAADALDVFYSTLCTYQRSIASDTFDYPPEKETFTVNGIVYASVKEAAKALGVSGTTLGLAKKKQGGLKTFEYHDGTCRKGPRKKVTINGVVYASIKDAAESLGVIYSTLRDARRRAKSDMFTYQRGKTPKPKGGVSSPGSSSKIV